MPHSRTLPCSRALSTLHGAVLSTPPTRQRNRLCARRRRNMCHVAVAMLSSHNPSTLPPARRRNMYNVAVTMLSSQTPSTTPTPNQRNLCSCDPVPTWTFNNSRPSVGATFDVLLLLCCPHMDLQPHPPVGATCAVLLLLWTFNNSHPPVGTTCAVLLLLCWPHMYLDPSPPAPAIVFPFGRQIGLCCGHSCCVSHGARLLSL